MSLGSCRTGVKGGKGLSARTGDAFGSLLHSTCSRVGEPARAGGGCSYRSALWGDRTDTEPPRELIDRRQDGPEDLQRPCQQPSIFDIHAQVVKRKDFNEEGIFSEKDTRGPVCKFFIKLWKFRRSLREIFTGRRPRVAARHRGGRIRQRPRGPCSPLGECTAPDPPPWLGVGCSV